LTFQLESLREADLAYIKRVVGIKKSLGERGDEILAKYTLLNQSTKE